MHMSFFNIITYFLGNCKRAHDGRCLFKTSAGSGHILCAGVAAPQIIHLWETYNPINHIEFAYKKVGLTL